MLRPESKSAIGDLVALVERRAAERPERVAYTFLTDGEDAEVQLTYGDLWRRVRAVASQLRGRRGERAVLLYAPDLEYVVAFFGCLFAGVVAVPAYPPDVSRLGRTLPRLQAIIHDARATMVMTTTPIASVAEAVFALAPELRELEWLTTDQPVAGAEEHWERVDVHSDDIAFIQYTSGSTGTPRGVVLTHRNLLHNQWLIQLAFGTTEASCGVGWLPLYHDMGLIGNVIQPIYVGFPIVLMSPLHFLKRPYVWLRAITKYRATHSGGPNFAFDVCVKKLTDADLQTLDLSSWELAFNGAEAVRPETLDNFARRFAQCGFRREALFPCYGLAEASLIVTGGKPLSGPVVGTFDASSLHEGRAEGPSKERESRSLVSSGRVLGDQEVLVVNPSTRERAAARQIGEIWVRGGSVSKAYWGAPDKTAQVLEARLSDGTGPFLRTGDLGFFADGELYVNGRLKDLIIIRGRNHYPQDIERTVEESHPSIRMGSGAAFSVEVEGEERLVVAVEVERRGGDRRRPDGLPDVTERRKAERRQELPDPALNPSDPPAFDPEEMIDAIRRAIAQAHDLSPYAVLLLKAGTIPKTSSGKIQRHAARAGYLDGTLDVVGYRQATVDTGAITTGEEVLKAPPAERAALLGKYLKGQLGRALRVDAAEVPLSAGVSQLGLDSMQAIELVHEVEKDLGLALPPTTFLRDETIEQLGERLANALNSGKTSLDARRSSLPARRGSAPAPTTLTLASESVLSAGQEALWLLQQMNPASSALNIASALRVKGPLSADAVRGSLQAQLERHPVLRTAYRQSERGPRMKVTPPKLDFELIDRQGAAGEIEKEVSKAANEPFDLEAGKVLRVRLYRLAPDDHVLLVAVHHIAGDLWSLVLMLSELRVLYPAMRSGRGASYALPSASYVEHVGLERAYLDSADGSEDAKYWEEKLAGAPTVLELPTDRLRPARLGDAGGAIPVSLDESLIERAHRLAREQSTTLFVVLLSAFEAVLSRYSRQRDFLVGSPVNGRSRAEYARTVGYFVNPVPLRAELGGRPTFRELLERNRRTVLEGLEHARYPFPRIVERLSPERDASRNPLVQVMFVLDRPMLEQEQDVTMVVLGQVGRAEFEDLSLSPFALPHRTAQFDLTLNLAQAGNRIAGALEYHAELFDEATVARLGEHFVNMFEAALANPDAPVEALDFLAADERRKLLVEWNATSRPYPHDKTIQELFEEHARRAPNAIAVLDGDHRLTYGELNRLSNQLAHYLIDQGVGRGDRVGVLMERSREVVVALLGILKAGAAYVPVECSTPRGRRDFIFESAGARVVLSSLPAHLETLSTESLGVRACPASTAYILYTSGSTGLPKGTLVPHRAVVRLVREQTYVQATADDCVAFASSIAFDATTFELWAALLNGGRLAVVPRDTLLDAERLSALLVDAKVTIAWVTAALFTQLIAQKPDCFASLRYLCTGGDRVDPKPVIRAFEAGPPRVIADGYGPTETTTFATYHWVSGPDEVRGLASVPIGRPIANDRVYVVDDSLALMPMGSIGELCIAGAGVSDGYLGRRDLTAEKFVPNPFSAEPGARMYRTGDLVRWRSPHVLEFVGRVDRQIKIRGFRVELEEIEASLSAHPSVDDAVVTVHEAAAAENKRIIAYVAPKDGAALDAGELREHARSRLPEYMVPSAFVVMNELPLTPSGKVDRKALPAPHASVTEGEYVAPRTLLEEQLCGIFRDVLGVARVGVRDNFFELGGHSLLAARLVTRVASELGARLPLRSLFDGPTVAELAERCRELSPSTRSFEVAPVDRTKPVAASPAQERIWFVQQLEPESRAYFMSAAARLTGPLDVAALGRALDAVVERHESLRTSFAAPSGRLEALIAGAAPKGLLRVAAFDGDDVALREQIEAEMREPFDFSRAPLFRALLLARSATEHVLVATFHHIIFDGWSASLFMSDLAALYGELAFEQSADLRPLPLQYADFAAWESERLRADSQGDVGFWREALADAPLVLDLPTDRPRPNQPAYEGSSFTYRLPPELAARVRRFVASERVTLHMLLLTAFGVQLGRLAGQRDVLVGVPVANRDHPDAAGIIGCFMNTVAMRVDFRERQSFRQLVARVREVAVAALEHGHVPFETVIEQLRPPRHMSRSPVVQVMLNTLTQPAIRRELPGLVFEGIPVEEATGAKFDVTLYAEPDELALTFVYRRDLFDAARMEEMARQLETLLESALTEPERPVDAIPLGRRSPPVDTSLRLRCSPTRSPLDRFVDLATRRPEAPAIVGDVALDYGALAGASADVANGLRELGVGTGDVVGIHAERRAELVVAILGVLSSGAAFTILDAAYPAEALATRLRKSGARAVVDATSGKELDTAGLPRLRATTSGTHGSRLTSRRSPDDRMYVAFTSGTTGEPKAIAGSDGPVGHFLDWYERSFHVGPSDRVSMLSGLAHDPLLRDVFGALGTGGTLCIPPEGTLLDPDALARWLETSAVTLLHVTPSQGEVLAHTSDAPKLGGVRSVFFGGERLRTPLLRELRKRMPRASFVNFYGATETPQAMGFHVVDEAELEVDAIIPIGRGIDDVQLLVLDAGGALAGLGEVGEIVVRTPYLASYLGDPASPRFGADPFAPDSASRVYRTGDRGRYRADGVVECLGRDDNQVKVRGFRVELEDVEAALRRHPAVSACAVIAREEGLGGAQLVAFVTTNGESSAAVEDLRRHCAAALPGYMVPSRFGVLDALPLTPNGKLDRRALASAEATSGTAYEAPRNAEEEQLCAIFAELLGTPNVGIDDDFFTLGGHSLLATRLVSRVRKDLGRELSLKAVFEASTVRKLAGALFSEDSDVERF